MNDEKIFNALKKITYPGFSRDIVSFGIVSKAILSDSIAIVELELTTKDDKILENLKISIKKTLLEVTEVTGVEIVIKNNFQDQNPDNSGSSTVKLDGIKTIIAIASGKGGVGKSTVAVNLACALAQTKTSSEKENQVGLMDCDVYGPSVPQLMGCWERPTVIEENLISPVLNYGVKMISMGLLVDEESPVVWRGPMIMKTIQQFASNVDWGNLDCLLIDLPPGTGDAQLSIAQVLSLDGVIIVTTPQKTAFDVAKRGAKMFEKLNIPYLGVIENMSYMENPITKEKTFPFGNGGGGIIAENLKTRLLAEIPLEEEIRQGGDHGIPIVIGAPEHSSSKEFYSLAARISDEISS